MMHVGIFTGYYPYSLKETAQKIQAQGFTTVQLDLAFKDMDLSTAAITKQKCHTIRDTFRDHNLPICCPRLTTWLCRHPVALLRAAL